MYRIFKNIIPLFFTLTFVYLYYNKFYTDSLSLLNPLLLFGAVVSLVFTLLPEKRRFFHILYSFVPFLVVFTFTYNFLFAVAGLILSIIAGIFVPKARKYTQILFTDDCEPLYINHTVKKSFWDILGFSRNVFALLILIVLIFSFVLPQPCSLWLMRAFPVDFSQNETFSGEAIPLGIVTSTAWYDDNAIRVDSFYDIDNTVPSPGKEAGLASGDIIVKINGERALLSDFLTKGADESPVTLTVKRLEGDAYSELSVTVTPVYSYIEGRWLIGITYYSSASISASVQTLTFAYADTGYFAGTAHSSDALYDEMGTLKGVLFSSYVQGRDEEGLQAIPRDVIGVNLYTDNYGCYGILKSDKKDTLPIGEKNQFRPGKATLLSTVEGDEPVEYSLFIAGTYRIDQRDVMFLTVTDPRLIEKGGITRGMSGSPIIQNGRIIGALSNMDEGGRVAYATFAHDMAHQLYLGSKNFSREDYDVLFG